MMAQKVNSLNLRLKKRLNWESVFCVHNFNDYYSQMLNSTKLLDVSKNLMYNMKMLQNTISLTKTSKNFKINAKILAQNYFLFLIKNITIPRGSLQNYISYRQSYLQIFRSIFKVFLLNKKQLLFQPVNMESQKKFRRYYLFKSGFLTLSPQVFTEFVKMQLASTNAVQLTSNNFKKSLQNSLLNLIGIFLREFKYDILGIKIICQGKWKKTNTGRKQKIYLKFGRIQTSNLANKIIYHGISQKTKFGVCSIKIWIAHKL